ncbi:hypothetical protein LguiA_033261 [Lonicera macranthoides]
MSPPAEVLDHFTGRVEKLPKSYEGNYNLLGFDRVLKSIVFRPCITNHVTEPQVSLVLFYYPVIKAWKEESHPALVNNRLQLFSCSARVVASSIIYWFSGLQVKAYDDFVNLKLHYSSKSKNCQVYAKTLYEITYFQLQHRQQHAECVGAGHK